MLKGYCRYKHVLNIFNAKGVQREMIFLILVTTTSLVSAGKSWSRDHVNVHGNNIDSSGPKSHLEGLEVVCSRDHMTVHMQFDEPFYGVIFSHGSPRHERCVHVGPRSGVTSISFDIGYDSCGTVEDLSGQFHENTIVIQFDEDILEAWDMAKRLRCEWLESFEKKPTKPTLAISDIDVVELNFQGDDIDCWMEVQEGKGPWARQVGGLVPIGSPLTLVIAINDHSREFDMRIKRCSASDGTGSEIELTDDNGCVLRPSLLTPFVKVRDFNGKATLVAYSHLYSFKFPDKIDVFVYCIVEVCRHGCPDSCSHQYGDHHSTHGTLESKKIQKLVSLSHSKPAHEIRHNQPFPKTPDSSHGPAFIETERVREILAPAAQTQIQQISPKNSSFSATSGDRKVNLQLQRATFSPTAYKNAQKAKEAKAGEEKASTNIHGVFVDIGNTLSADKSLKSSSHSQPPDLPIPSAHRLIGHDVHWIEDVKATEETNRKNIPLLGQDISYHVPKPEPATWSADEVRPLSKHEVFPQPVNVHEISSLLKDISYQGPKPEPSAWSADEVKSLSKHEVFLQSSNVRKIPSDLKDFSHQAPKPEPSAWSADEVKPLSKHEVFLQSSNVRKIPSELKDFSHQAPKPEPSAWSADEVKVLSKQEVFHRPNPGIDVNIHQYHSKSQHDSKIHVPSNHYKSNGNVPSLPRPQPEPASWTFEEINPMINPKAVKHQPNIKRPNVPKPEPSAWSLDDVKGFNKEDIRLLSLNHKVKSHRNSATPFYKEFVHPFSTTTLPQPVYVTKYNPIPQNMSSANMMKMMMMMSTMLPPTYQTAHWPQRTTARYLRRNRHHYPYPIPQFSRHQQMMMSVIADRRMDGENDDLLEEDVSLNHKVDEGGEPRRIQIGETASLPKQSPPNNSDSEDYFKLAADETVPDKSDSVSRDIGTDEENENKTDPGMILESVSGDILQNQPDTGSISKKDHASTVNPDNITDTVLPDEEISKGNTDAGVEVPANESGPRPAISGFVPPSLDEEVGANPESKDRKVPGPRALDRKKRSSEPVFSVRQKFQAIAPSDLAFEWNLTTDGAIVLHGRREDIVYGICMSPASMSAGVGFILILTLLCIIASVVFYEHSCKLSNKTSQLSFLTRNFNGQFETLYKITRPYLYSGNSSSR